MWLGAQIAGDGFIAFDLRHVSVAYVVFFFFKQKTAYEIVSRDWSSDVCSSDLGRCRNENRAV